MPKPCTAPAVHGFHARLDGLFTGAFELRDGMLFYMKRLSKWGWMPVVVLLAAVPLGLHFLDRRAADAATRSGRAAINSKQYSQAVDYFNRAIQIDPKC